LALIGQGAFNINTSYIDHGDNIWHEMHVRMNTGYFKELRILQIILIVPGEGYSWHVTSCTLNLMSIFVLFVFLII